MSAAGSYILRICCCALIAGILLNIGGDGPGSHVRKMICGLFIAFVVISPLRDIRLNEIWELPEEIYQEGLDITTSAEADTAAAISDIIIQQSQSYILDEADSLGAQIRVESITLDESTLIPVQVTLSGTIAPYARSQLTDYIESTLGIGKEAQIWTD